MSQNMNAKFSGTHSARVYLFSRIFDDFLGSAMFFVEFFKIPNKCPPPDGNKEFFSDRGGELIR